MSEQTNHGQPPDPAEDALAAEFGRYLSALAVDFGEPFTRMLTERYEQLSAHIGGVSAELEAAAGRAASTLEASTLLARQAHESVMDDVATSRKGIETMGQALALELEEAGRRAAVQAHRAVDELIETKAAITRNADEVAALRAALARMRRSQQVLVGLLVVVLVGMQAWNMLG